MRVFNVYLVFPALITLFMIQTLHALEALSPDVPYYTSIVTVWKTQDSVSVKGYRSAIEKIAAGLPLEIRTDLLNELNQSEIPDSSTAALEQIYLKAATARRLQLLEPYLPDSSQIVYSAHGVWTQIYYDNANERGGNLVLITMKGGAGTPSILVQGETRDPDVSFDGKRVLYSFRDMSSGKNSYHLYEIDLQSKISRQITSGGTASDYRHNSDVDGIYLPNDDIMFCSTRMVQMGDCLDDNSVTANLFLCNKDGRFLRRISFDQAHICYPSVLSNGQVIYCRWDYNDKNHTYAHGLFVVNPDGTKQMEFYGNNSWWPTALYYPREIPGTHKIMAIAGGYHSGQAGIVCTVDRNLGIANGEGITLLAPVRNPKDDTEGIWASSLDGLTFEEYRAKWGPYAFDPATFPKPDAYPNDYWTSGPCIWPYPLDENCMLVCWNNGLLFMTVSGQKELICTGPCASPRLVTGRPKPTVIADNADWGKNTGICQIMNIYTSQDPLLKGILPGTIKRLRVVALEYRTGPSSGAGGMNCGPGSINNGGATTPIPIATVGASWDVKKIIGETPVESDGSASFYVPARTPVYFQALDEKGHVVQTMRSWATIMPGEVNSCMGCHESKLTTPQQPTSIPIAVKRGPVPLDSFYGPPRGFSFTKEIQPILDAKCVACHNETTPDVLDLSRGTVELPLGPAGSWTKSGRTSSKAYQNLVTTEDWDYRGKYVWWQSAEDSPLLQPPYRTGASRSPLISLLDAGHNSVTLTKEEYDKICAWIDIGVPSSGDYCEGLTEPWVSQIAAREAERRNWEAQEKRNINDLLGIPNAEIQKPSSSKGRFNNQIQLRAYLNPVSDIMVLQFTIPDAEVSARKPQEQWSLALFDCAGRLLRNITRGSIKTGQQRVYVKLRNDQKAVLSHGTYFCTLQTPGLKRTVKIVLVDR